MRLSMVSLFMILTTVFLSGCTQGGRAALDDRSGNFYGKQGVVPLFSGGQGFASNATVQAAPVGAIASNDLTPALAGATSASPHIMPKQTQAPLVLSRQESSAWQWPVNGKVTENFGKQANGEKNEGITISAAEGAPIRAAQAGEVAYVGHGVKSYGNMVILRHADGAMSSYAHAKDITVSKGQQVAAGSVIGHVGLSGGVNAPQLHFALHEGASTIDPLSKLPSQVAAR